jgi:hypothetical protein
MAKIVDPDQLTQGLEVTFNLPSKLIQLAVTGNLDDNSPGKSSGVTHQALYSFAKEEWLADTLLQPIRFPFDPIFEAKFDWINNWQPSDQQTIDLLRDGGFRVVLNDEEYASIISLQTIDDPNSDLAYYWQIPGFQAPTSSFDKTGELNEPISILSGTIGANDYRDFLKVALRVQGKTYAEGNLLLDQDLAILTYQAYRLPLANAIDPNITETDNDIDTLTPYTNMRLSFLKGVGYETFTSGSVYPVESVVFDPNVQVSSSLNGSWWFTPGGGTANGTNTGNDIGITDWEPFAGQEQIGTEWFAFNRILDTSTGTATKEEFYQWGQRQLRIYGDINDDALGAPNQDGFGVVTGSVARLLFDFVGTQLVTRGGVLIRNFDPNDTNSITLSDITVDGGGVDTEFTPVTTTARNFPFVAAGVLVFSDNLVSEPDVDTLYKMFFQYTTRNTGTDVAVTAASGDTATLTSSTTNFTTNFANGAYVSISGFANTTNNGLFQVDGVPTATTMPIRKVNGQTLINETAGPTVNLDADPYDSPDAIVVNNNAGSPITGQITAQTIAFDFDYDNNVQGGRTPAQLAPVAVIAQGREGAQWVDGLFTISRATGLSFPLNAATERVYANP